MPNGIHHPPIEDGRLLPNSVKKGEREGQKGVSLVTVQKAFQSKTNLESDRWKEIVKVATKLIEERQNDQNKA
ncbi:hypothetical protein LDA69_15150 [Enterococcus faecium]|nr:hypothetical protein [Enterococcus faecium]